jgi:hypothetical protein
MEYCQPAFLLGANCGAVQIPGPDTTKDSLDVEVSARRSPRISPRSLTGRKKDSIFTGAGDRCLKLKMVDL